MTSSRTLWLGIAVAATLPCGVPPSSSSTGGGDPSAGLRRAHPAIPLDGGSDVESDAGGPAIACYLELVLPDGGAIDAGLVPRANGNLFEIYPDGGIGDAGPEPYGTGSDACVPGSIDTRTCPGRGLGNNTGPTGERWCDANGRWSPCWYDGDPDLALAGFDAGPPVCAWGDSQACRCVNFSDATPSDTCCSTYGCTYEWCDPTGQWSPCDWFNTPIVLSFDVAPVRSEPAAGSFDLDGTPRRGTTDWPTATTPWLALDRSGNGLIDDGSELFGSMTRLRSGARAHHGFEALAELDANGDGVLDAKDPGWPQLLVWRDVNRDRVSQPRELVPLEQLGVVSLSLAYRVEPHCDARGNCEVERSAFTWRDRAGGVHRGEAIDLHLRKRALLP